MNLFGNKFLLILDNISLKHKIFDFISNFMEFRLCQAGADEVEFVLIYNPESEPISLMRKSNKQTKDGQQCNNTPTYSVPHQNQP